MNYAPALFITNGAGVLVARADTIIDRVELSDLLNQAK
jgi:hypothetical protein